MSALKRRLLGLDSPKKEEPEPIKEVEPVKETPPPEVEKPKKKQPPAPKPVSASLQKQLTMLKGIVGTKAKV